MKLLRSEVSPYGEVFLANLTSLCAKAQNFTGNANFTFAKQKLHQKKFFIMKECAETEYWVEIMAGCNAITSETAQVLLQECGIIRRMLAKSITTAKNNKE